MNNLKKKTILLVEDDAVTGMVGISRLERSGYKVIHTKSGEDSINIVRKNRELIDLVLMDIDLGDGIDGTEAAQEILKEYNIPVLFLSSHTEMEVLNKTENITSYGYVVKNSSFTVLDASIKMAFKLYEAYNEIQFKMMEIENAIEKLETANSELKNTQINLLKKNMEHDEIERKYYDVYNNTLTGMFQISTDGCLISANPAFAKSFGYESNEIMIKKAAYAGYHLHYKPDDMDRFIKQLVEHGHVMNFEASGHTINGDAIWSSINASAITNDSGEIELIAGTLINITKQKLDEEKIQLLLKKKELILTEVHHRIKNNMTVIYSLLKLQADNQENVKIQNVLLEAAGRVQSMAVLYDKLYRSEIKTGVAAIDYFPVIISDIMGIFPEYQRVQVKTQIDDIILSPQQLYPLGIIICEFITNSMKYAFTCRNDGIISLIVLKKGDRVNLIFEDNGAGLPEYISIENSSGFGMQLVKMLVDQIRGSITIEREHGTRFILEFGI